MASTVKQAHTSSTQVDDGVYRPTSQLIAALGMLVRGRDLMQRATSALHDASNRRDILDGLANPVRIAMNRLIDEIKVREGL